MLEFSIIKIIMKKVEKITINKQQSYALTIQSIILFFIGGAIFRASIGSEGFTKVGLWGIVVYVMAVAIHELLHGVGFLIAGARPRFGVGIAGIIPVAYATTSTKLRVSRMLIVAYLPLVVLSAVCIFIARQFPEYQTYALIAFVGNFAGAVGDLWIASKLWKYLPYKDVLVLDSKSGCDVYSNNPNASIKGAKATKKSKRKSSFSKNWAICSLVIMVIQFLSPPILLFLGFNNNFTLGFSEFYLFKIESKANEGSMVATINLLTPLIVGLILALVIQSTKSRNSKAL